MLSKNIITDLFSTQVGLTPQNIALEFLGEQLSYKELDQRSNQLAHYLKNKGVQEGMTIPVCINRCLEMIIGILGIIKSGAVYVPIDPSFPAERIQVMLYELDSNLVISNSTSAKNIFDQVILLDTDWPQISEEPDSKLEVKLDPSDLIYIIYTSGSTGKPKGVMIEHQSLANYITAQTSYFGITAQERIAQFSNYSFDASVEQIFLALLNGACLVLIPEELIKDAESFAVFLNEKSITHLHATPGFLENLNAENNYQNLKRIISAGEICKKELFKKWQGKVDFYNKYGPTEGTISVLEYHCPASGIDDLKVLPIGKPIQNTAVYILDEELNQVDQGELYIGGIQIARGYFNQPELTDQRFITNPFKAGERLYKTGDLAKWSFDGNVEFLGRTDDQVKIRGYRIEIGEIENTLREIDGIKQSVVTVQDDGNNGKRLIAYVIPTGVFDKDRIKQQLLLKLPEYMVPQFIIEIEEIPLTGNGKVDKKRLPAPDLSELLDNIYVRPKYETEKTLAQIWQTLLKVKRVGITDNFFELGGNSLLAQKLVTLLKENKFHLPVTKLYQYPTVEGIAAFLDGRNKAKANFKKVKHNTDNTDIAVIGMSARFPGAKNINQYWDNIIKGKESIHFFADEELDPSIPEDLKQNPGYVKARGIIEDHAKFDPAFFGISPHLASVMDPQQRIFLEISWEALEQSGHIPQKYKGTIGVFTGCRFNTYYSKNVIFNKELIENIGSFQVGTVNDKDYIATRTAYSLNLKGPAVNVQSACSTSLLAIAEAVSSIRNGQCDIALAGASSMLIPVNSGHLYEEGAMLSNDGHCRAFDADAKGTVFSDGAGVVVLKSRIQAELDGDTIYAVIKGVGLSNDGGEKGSFTAPSADGQAAAVSMAIDDAGVSAGDISYIETHGTATPLGDPIEIEGLNIAFGEQPQKQYCAIGSVKSNIGHLTSASGVAGVIKTALALYHKQLPPSINYDTPNPHIDFENSPFFVNTTLNNWNVAADKKRIAGVSSFGVGGTNVHLILEEAGQQPKITGKGRPLHLLCWSAKTENSMEMYGTKLSDYLKNEPHDLADIAYTLNTSRDDFNHRRFIIAKDAAEFIEKSANAAQNVPNTKHLKEKPKEIVFMFPGQGAQFLHMGKDLYDSEPVFRQSMDECAEILRDELKEDILSVIYPGELNESANDKLNNTRYSQPALFIIGYSLGKLWMSWDIFPSAFIGHSIGEFVAAYFSGILTLKDALKLIAARGRMMGDLPKGCMLSVRTDPESVKELLSSEIALAAVNSPNLSVVAGAPDAIAKLSDELNEKGILNRLLPTSHAFHSHMMDPVVEPFKKLADSIELREPVIPIMSTVTGQWLKNEEATDPGYWATHLRSTVRFSEASQQLINDEYMVYLELGPGNSATTLLRQQAAGKQITVVATLEKGEAELTGYQSVLRALGQLWLNGIEPNWFLFYKQQNRIRLMELPTYAFDHKDYWVDPPISATFTNTIPAAETIITQQPIKYSPIMRKQLLIDQVKEILENTSGIDLSSVTPEMTFIEMGLDSLLLTQVALNLKKKFSLPITFRQLNEEYSNLDLLSSYLDHQLPADLISAPPVENMMPSQRFAESTTGALQQSGNGTALDLISQQLQLLARQVSILQGNPAPSINQTQMSTSPVHPAPLKDNVPVADLTPEETLEIKKPFGAAAKIEKQSTSLNEVQQNYLNDLIIRYNEKTKGSKTYTQQHRAYMADPRVVSGFRPATKELVYSIVINKSKGSRLWDIDGNEYIDALNGFGSNMLGYQPDFIKQALMEQIEKGYEIGPQHELSGEVSKLICDFTSFDRAALCNTGSEAVLGAMRIARTVTGRSLIVAFTGSYHGIADEVIVRGSKKLKTFPAAPGIMPEAVQNMLILDYGTDESLKIIEERAQEIAAVLVEPVQSRRADFQPVEFLKKLRKITEDAEAVLIFDEVISGFRFHPGGVQAIFGIKADIGTYGKVAGGGISIGIIAGKKKYMDALDGGFWQYGDASIPEVGVTYFAGTFVRHPLALATAKASLTYLKEAGPSLQENLNINGLYIASEINKICQKLRVPIFIAQYGSLWRIRFIEEYPYSELFFTLMRYKGIHILEGFACFLTTAHSSKDIQQIINCFKESLIELKDAGFIPDYAHDVKTLSSESLNLPPVPNARIGKDKDGNPAWFVKDEQEGKYLQVK